MMTFQEAVTVINVSYAYPSKVVKEAVDTIKFFEDNVLELEDYETDQLYKALEHIKNKKLGESKMTNKQFVSVEELNEMGTKLNEIMKIVMLQNSFIDFVPASEKLNNNEIRLNYMRVHEALHNLYEINQDIATDLDDISSVIYRMKEELEIQEEEQPKK